MTPETRDLVATLQGSLRELADPAYVDGTVAARNPGKPVLGIRIPPLRAAVRAALKRHRSADIPAAADALWRSEYHEEELAACMMLRLSEIRIESTSVRRWAGALDNWLSVDELAGCVGASLSAAPSLLKELEFLATSTSAWQRRLYLASLIRPVREGMDPSQVPHLADLFCDQRKPVHMAAAWLVRSALKARPEAAEQFAAVWSPEVPKPLARLLEQARVL
jgi:3-methyladenine DNA glycosylase AlkD